MQNAPDWPAGESAAVWVRATGREERREKARARKKAAPAKPKVRKASMWDKYLPT